MQRFLPFCSLILLVNLMTSSCQGDSDDIVLDGDMITVIKGASSIYATSALAVNFEQGGNDANFASFDLQSNVGNESLTISGALVDATRLDTFRFSNTFRVENQISLEYAIYNGSTTQYYIPDLAEPHGVVVTIFNDREIEGTFFCKVRNVQDETDFIELTDGYFYAYD